MAKYTRLSQRKYADLIGVSNTAVSKAIQNKKIVKGFDKETGEIIVELANKEWGNLHMKNNIEDLLQQESEAPKQPAKKSELLSYAEARRYRENCAAKLAAMDVQQRTGELVRKDDVRAALFAYGQGLRTNLLSIPDRVIDNVLASKSRAEAHGLMYNALIDALIDLTTNKDFDFNPTR